MILRAHATRLLLLALAGVLLLLGVFAGMASADEYGGLGSLGTFKAGRNGGPLEVNPRSHRAFGVAPDGSSYIAETIEVEGTLYFRIQKLGSKGEYLAEARVKLTVPAHQLEGVAIDAEKQRMYVLVVGEREPEIEEQPVFDPEAPVAAELYAFSTEVKEGKIEPVAGTTAGLLTSEKAFDSLSKEGGVSLLNPHGIAVDPTTHDVLILGQQDVSTKKGSGEEELRAAVQRVHTEGSSEGKLGPRYVDKENCLDDGAVITAEPACAEDFGQPSSPFISPGGRLYGERSRELWEIPSAEGDSESFEPGSPPKIYEAKPKRLFTMGRGEGIKGEEDIVKFASEGEEGGALAFVPTAPGEGKIYSDANITAEEGEGSRSPNPGAVVLDYSETSGRPEARELGWTAGQNETGENEKCILPLGNLQILVGADSSGRLLLFDVKPAVISHNKPATVNLLVFGAGGEECGHAQATPPSASVLGEPVTKLPAGKTASLSLDVLDADTQSVEWRFKDNGKEEADEPPVLESYPFPTQVPTLTHEFKHGGNYEIIAIVEPDDFGPKIEEHSNVTVEGGEGAAAMGAEFSYTSPATVGESAKFTAKVTDPNNKASPDGEYKYVWEFGDGAKVEGSGTRELRAEHVYADAGHYEVKLTVVDEGGRTADETHTVQINAPRAPVSASSSGAGGVSSSNSGGKSGGGGAGSGTSGITSTHVPEVTLVGTSLVVSRSGGVTLRLACPGGETSCSGTVTLRTLGVVSGRSKAHAKKSVLTLAAGPFTVVGGHVKTIILYLSAKARVLLVRSHLLRARATLLAHDPAGGIHTTRTVVTLRIATSPRHR